MAPKRCPAMPDQPLDFLSPDATAAAAAGATARDKAALDRSARGAPIRTIPACSLRPIARTSNGRSRRSNARLLPCAAPSQNSNRGSTRRPRLCARRGRFGSWSARYGSPPRAGDDRRRFRHLRAGGIAGGGPPRVSAQLGTQALASLRGAWRRTCLPVCRVWRSPHGPDRADHCFVVDGFLDLGAMSSAHGSSSALWIGCLAGYF